MYTTAPMLRAPADFGRAVGCDEVAKGSYLKIFLMGANIVYAVIHRRREDEYSFIKMLIF